jgi:hypothetical protein
MAGDRRYRHLHGTATRRFVEHPLRNFERSVILLLLETTAKHGSRAFADHANDQRRAPVPRMPAISDNAAFGNMGVPLSVCTISAEGILVLVICHRRSMKGVSQRIGVVLLPRSRQTHLR